MRRAPALLLALLTAALTGACGGAAFDGQVYHGRNYAYRLGPAPANWHPLPVTHGDLAFRDEAAEATVAVNGRCADGDDVPLASLTQHLFLRFTEREIERQEVVPFDGREAMHTVMVAKLDGVPLKFDVWVLKKDGCVYDLYYMAPSARFGRGSAEFTRFALGFHTETSHGN